MEEGLHTSLMTQTSSKLQLPGTRQKQGGHYDSEGTSLRSNASIRGAVLPLAHGYT